MAALESLLPLSFLNPPLISRSKLLIPTKLLLNKSYPHHISISRRLKASSSSSAAVAALEEDDSQTQTEKSKKEIGENNRVFVLNLPWSYSVDDLKNLFGECGSVQDAEIIKRKKDGKSRGYAFVRMGSTEEALSVIEKYDSHELMGRIIRVEFAKDNKKSSSSSSSSSRARATATAGGGYKLYVSNLAWKVRSKDVKRLFDEFNPISTRVVFENQGSRSAGYGFVNFASKQEAESALSALNGKELFGRPISVRFSQTNANANADAAHEIQTGQQNTP